MQQMIVKGEGLTVDLILHRLYGLRGRTLVEATYDANPGLCGLGLVLPLGTDMRIPELPAELPFTRKVASLFD